jgi:hypothetical protein
MEIVATNGYLLAADEAGLQALSTGSARLRQRPGPDNALGRVKFVLSMTWPCTCTTRPPGPVRARATRIQSWLRARGRPAGIGAVCAAG